MCTNSSYDICLQLRPPALLNDPKGHFTADLSTTYNRIPHPNATLEERIEQLWQEKLAKYGDKLWNATKFHLHSITANGTLRLGITDYRTYQGTTLSSPYPLEEFGDVKYISRALGNACILVSADGYVPFLIRSGAVGEGAGYSGPPGGHAEPSRLGIDCINAFQAGNTPSIDTARIMHELYYSIVAEVYEELHIPENSLDTVNMKMLGVVQRNSDLRPQLVMSMTCSLSSGQIKEHWCKGTGQEGDRSESSGIIFISVNNLSSVVSTGRVNNIRLMPEHHGAVDLFVRCLETD